MLKNIKNAPGNIPSGKEFSPPFGLLRRCAECAAKGSKRRKGRSKWQHGLLFALCGELRDAQADRSIKKTKTGADHRRFAPHQPWVQKGFF